MKIGLVFKTLDPSFHVLYYQISQWASDNFNCDEIEFSSHIESVTEQAHGLGIATIQKAGYPIYHLKIVFQTEESYNLFRLMFARTGYERYIRTTWWGDESEGFIVNG